MSNPNENEKKVENKNGNAPPIIQDDQKSEDSKEENVDDQLKKNLMFEQKNISPIKLYCHLSETTEIVLMIFGVIGSLGSGIAGPLMTLLFGDMINDFAGTSGGGIDPSMPIYWNEMMKSFKKTVAKMVKKINYYWSFNVCCKFFNDFYVGL